MSPKFKGDSEDWLDDEGDSGAPRSRTAVKKFSPAKAEFLPVSEGNATVQEVHPNLCRVKLDHDGSSLLCVYRRSGVLKKDKVRERSFVAVGDRVKVESGGVVQGVCVRRNKLSRSAPGREDPDLHHVIAANLDLVVIVASVREPDFSEGLIDRFLVGAMAAGIEPLICVTKMDLQESGKFQGWRLYQELGFRVVEMSSKQGTGLDALREQILGKAVLFCGKSGVGKTSLLRGLLGAEVGRVGEISQATGKGRHTTTGTILLGGPSDSSWMDSPGVREFGLVELKPENLPQFFPEFRHLDCPAPGCLHVGEPNCKAVHCRRHSSYLRIRESLLERS